MSERRGHRGYIGSRAYFGDRAPQHVQNLVVRDYCQRQGFIYLLSATEYMMPGCYVMLEEVLRELPSIEGVVLYSLFMLPKQQERRHVIYRRVLDAGATLHGAVENISIRGEADLAAVEDIWQVRGALADNALLSALRARN